MGSFAVLALVVGLTAFLSTIEGVPLGKDWPNFNRRLTTKVERPGCIYKNQKFEHGDRVDTPEPCLNCTCIKAVLVCYLKVCPSALATPPGCFQARELGQCCPTLVCGIEDIPTGNGSGVTSDLRPIFKPELETSTIEETTKITTVDYTPSTTEDSLLVVSSTQEWSNDLSVYTDAPPDHLQNNGCLVNGTLYADGSAMLSNSFCEYCFCIRGNQTCLQPRCNLDIEGCVPEYDSEFICCPSRYNCSMRNVANNSEAIRENALVELDTVTVVSTDSAAIKQKERRCVLDNKTYSDGEMIPDYALCHNCYCSNSSVVCNKMNCTAPIDGCQAIVPEGHCCPISYRCEYQPSHLKNGVKRPSEEKTKSQKSTITKEAEEAPSQTLEDSSSSILSLQPESERQAFLLENQNLNNARENDKTLNLENDKNSTKRKEVAIDKLSSFREDLKKIAATGSPETKILSIPELLDRYFPTAKTNKTFNEGHSLETVRNNSKLPAHFESESYFNQNTSFIHKKDTNKGKKNKPAVVASTQSSAFFSEDATKTSIASGCESSKCHNFTVPEMLTSDEQKTSTYTEHTTDNIRVSTYTQELTTDNIKASTYTQELTTDNIRASTYTQELTTDNIRASAYTQELTTDEFKDSTNTELFTTPKFRDSTITDLLTTDKLKYSTNTELLTTDKFKDSTNTELLTTDKFKGSTNTELLTTDKFKDSTISELLTTDKIQDSSYTASLTTGDFISSMPSDQITTVEFKDTTNTHLHITHELKEVTFIPDITTFVTFNQTNGSLPPSTVNFDSTISPTVIKREAFDDVKSQADFNKPSKIHLKNHSSMNRKVKESFYPDGVKESNDKINVNVTPSSSLTGKTEQTNSEEPNVETVPLEMVTPHEFTESEASTPATFTSGQKFFFKGTRVLTDEMLTPEVSRTSFENSWTGLLANFSDSKQKIEKYNYSQGIRDRVHLATAKDYYPSIASITPAIVDDSDSDVVADFCFVDGRIFRTGETILKNDPCQMCRCFYGQELCQLQKCPTPPSSGCSSQLQPGYCCPRITCGSNPDELEEDVDNTSGVKFGIRIRTDNSSPQQPSTTRTWPTAPQSTSYTTITYKRDFEVDTTTPQGTGFDPWQLQLSGCNIYGKYFNINDSVGILSGSCSHCICTANGVECNDIC